MKNSLKDRIMICITMILLKSIFRRFITILNGIRAILATFGTVCSLIFNLKPCTRRARLGERNWRVAVERSSPRKESKAPRFCATFARRT